MRLEKKGKKRGGGCKGEKIIGLKGKEGGRCERLETEDYRSRKESGMWKSLQKRWKKGRVLIGC